MELDEVKKELKPGITRSVLLTMLKTIMPKIQKKLSCHNSPAPVEGDQFVFPISSERESEQPPSGPSSYKTTSIIFGHEWNQTNLAAQKKRRIRSLHMISALTRTKRNNLAVSSVARRDTTKKTATRGNVTNVEE